MLGILFSISTKRTAEIPGGFDRDAARGETAPCFRVSRCGVHHFGRRGPREAVEEPDAGKAFEIFRPVLIFPEDFNGPPASFGEAHSCPAGSCARMTRPIRFCASRIVGFAPAQSRKIALRFSWPGPRPHTWRSLLPCHTTWRTKAQLLRTVVCFSGSCRFPVPRCTRECHRVRTAAMDAALDRL